MHPVVPYVNVTVPLLLKKTKQRKGSAGKAGGPSPCLHRALLTPSSPVNRESRDGFADPRYSLC